MSGRVRGYVVYEKKERTVSGRLALIVIRVEVKEAEEFIAVSY